jgi:hypothetical protein
MRGIGIILIVVSLVIHSYEIFSDIKISGAIRNDAALLKTKDSEYFNDILENKIILSKNSEDWKFYTDARAFLYYGEVTNTMGEYDFRLMRSFIRYFTPIGDFTIGKTYINFGNYGLFNPFEFDKNVIFSDLSYIKEGMLAAEYEIPLGDLSSGKIFAGYSNLLNNYNTGLSLGSNLNQFDFGIVAARKGRVKNNQEHNFTSGIINKDQNNAGLYFKGDVFLGILGGYNFHFDDSFNKKFSEANAGIDYSFLGGNLILSSIFYYNEIGATKEENYNEIYDTYFFARYYIYGGLRFIYDEFLSFDNACFANLIDGSMLVVPSVIVVIANGLTATLQFAFLTGSGMSEFSRDTIGQYSILLRVEGKF